MRWNKRPNEMKACLLVERLEAREVLSATNPTTPLNDLGTGMYQGYQGGLYSNGTDMRPPAVETAGEDLASQIVPLDKKGNVDLAKGKIVMISVGMSNAAYEFDATSVSFEPRANADPSKNTQLTIVNGAQANKTADIWADPNNTVWNTVLDRLRSAGVTAKQVEVAWVKNAEPKPAKLGDFPTAAGVLQRDLEAIARNLKTYFPNIKIAYYSSRTHPFTTNPATLNPEPYAYESGFSVKWMIQDQIDGKNNLNYDPSKGQVAAPLLSWGPYLWANGSTPRSDGFTWTTADVQKSDLTHPNRSGDAKVADQLLAFFKTDPTATPWFLKHTAAGQGPNVTASADEMSGASGLTVQFTANASAVNGAIAQYAWTFDDGDFSLAQNPSKIFYAPGTYHVHLTVTDNVGNVTLRTLAITVTGSEGSALSASVAVSPATTTSPPSWANLPSQARAGGDGFRMATSFEWTGHGSLSLLASFLPETSRTSATQLLADWRTHPGAKRAPTSDWLEALKLELEQQVG